MVTQVHPTPDPVPVNATRRGAEDVEPERNRRSTNLLSSACARVLRFGVGQSWALASRSRECREAASHLSFLSRSNSSKFLLIFLPCVLGMPHLKKASAPMAQLPAREPATIPRVAAVFEMYCRYAEG